MKDIERITLNKYLDAERYQDMGEGVYMNLESRRHVLTMRFVLEEDDDWQYPLEDILDRYSVTCTDYIAEKSEGDMRILEAEMENGNEDGEESLCTMRKIASLQGRHVYNREEGGTIRLVIE